MKKMNKIYKAFLLFAALLLLASCSNGSENEKPVAAEGAVSEATVKITGSISLPSSARTAYSSGSGVEEWSVKATKGRKKEVIEVESDLTFSCELTPGTWKFTAYGLKTNPANNNLEPVLSGLTSVEITGTETPSQIKIPVSIEVSSGEAKINLKIFDETDRAKKYKVVFASDSNSNPSIPDIQGDFENGEATILKEEGITLSNALANYNAVITIYDTNNAVLFKCSEEVILFPNFTTDKWAGSSSYIDSDERFVLTDEIVKAYNKAKYSGSDNNTPLVLWNRLAADTTDSYIQGLQVFADLDSSNVVTKSLLSADELYENGESIANSWCFGTNNEFYYINLKAFYNDKKIVITKASVDTNSLYYEQYSSSDTIVEETDIAGSSAYMTFIDMKFATVNDVPYLFVLYDYSQGSTFNGDLLHVYDISGYQPGVPVASTILTRDKTSWINCGVSEGNFEDYNSVFKSLSIDEDNKKIYLARDNRGEKHILSFTFDNSDITYDDSINIAGIEGVTDYFTENNIALDAGKALKINEIKVLKGYLYILVSISDYRVHAREGSLDSSYDNIAASTGGILRYKISDSSFKPAADGSLILGAYLKDKEVYEDGGLVSKKIFAMPPLAKQNEAFFGPRKIVAIKPDELVIADDGYHYENKNLINEKNRIVRVSLKNWAISSVEDVSVMFDGKVHSDNCGTSLRTSGSN